MTTLRKLLYVTLLVVLVCVAAVFAYNNPEPVALDVGLARFENISLTLALSCAFGIGWLFGLATAGLALLRMTRERGRIKRALRVAETEVSSLRNLPISDAN